MKKFLLLIMSICLVMTSCTAKDSSKTKDVSTVENDDWKYGGSIQLACVPVDTLNPLVTSHASVGDVLSLVYEGLFECLSDQTVKKVLASEYKISENNTNYTIKLKSGIKFHDGTTFGPEDVVATLDYVLLYGTSYSSIRDNVILYNVVSKDTVSIKLKNPVADFVNCLDFPILPSGLVEDDFLADNSAFKPVGTGMYYYDKSEEDFKSIKLKSNPVWHGEKKPFIKSVDVQILSDADTIVASFDAGVIDLLTTSWKSPGDMNLTSSIFNTYETEQNRLTYIGINCFCADFDTVDERQFLKYSLNTDEIAKDIMLDNAVVADAPLRQSVYFNSDDDSADNKSDRLPRTNSVADDKEKDEVVLLYNSDSKTKERLAYALKYQLENKGYPVKLDAQPFNEYISRVGVGGYDLYVGEIGIDNSGNLEFMFGENRSSQNICSYRDGELYNFISNLNLAKSGDERSVVWNNFKKYYSDTVFQIPLYFTNGCSYVNKQVSGELSPNMSNLLSGFENLYVNKPKSQA